MATKFRVRRKMRRSGPPVRRTASFSTPGRADGKQRLANDSSLMIGGVHDPAEKQADKVAENVMRMPDAVLGKCATCDDDEKTQAGPPPTDGKEGSVKPKTAPGAAPVASGTTAAPASRPAARAINSLGGGRQLASAEHAFFAPRLGADLSGVRVHDDAKADRATRAINARAFAHGNDVAFASGEYAPGTQAGKRLMAHELAHVAELRKAIPWLRRKTTKVGTAFSHTAGAKSAFKKIHGEFDGANFKLFGDGKMIVDIAAQSGRPVSVLKADAKTCGGSVKESYLNNPRYLGIKDYGAIPEGTYHFTATELATFTLAEQTQFTAGGSFTDPFGKAMHGGDWGAARVALTPSKIVPAATGCGDTTKRSGFYMHGGSLTGSSGCIDVGNAGVSAILPHLDGFKKKIPITVKYLHPAPSVNKAQRVIGGFVYPGQKDPSISDRIKGAIEQLGDE